MSEDSKKGTPEETNRGPCVCSCYGREHENYEGVCSGKHFTGDGKYVECDCQKYVKAVERSGYAAKNREQDMLEGVGHLIQHSMIMAFESADENDKTDFKIMGDRLRKLRSDISEMTFAYGER